MEFSQIPENYSPIGQPLRYSFCHPTPETFDFRIGNRISGTVLGIKRLVAASSGSFDIAPYLRAAIRFVPAVGSTGFVDSSKRSVSVVVQAADGFSPARTYLPRLRVAQPGLLTTLPRTRLIAAGECEEITLLSSQPYTASVIARNGTSTEGETFNTLSAGLHIFRLNTTDYPGAEAITVLLGEAGEVEYLVVPRSQDACRLAWVSSEGSVEHYTFPTRKSVEMRCKKSKIYGDQGYVPAGAEQERRVTLLSAYETPQVLEALAEILASHTVWTIEGTTYTPIDVLSTEVCVLGPDAMQYLEISFRPIHKTTLR